MVPGDETRSTPSATASGEERSYSRRLSTDRLAELAVRGWQAGNEKPLPSHPTSTDSAKLHLRGAVSAASPLPGSPVVSIPATLEGTLSSGGEARRARFRVDSPVDIASRTET